jgi:hypothetical protein
MKQARTLLVFCAWAILASGCAATGGKETWVDGPPDAAVEMQEKNIALLTNYIDILNARLAESKDSPVPADPLLAQIRESDLAGVQIKLELISLLRSHAQYAREKLLEAKADPGRKPKILQEYRKRRAEDRAKMEVLDQRQDEQERKRMDLGLKLIEKALQ